MSPDGPLLVFGAGGQLGQEVLALGRTMGRGVLGVTRAEADIGDQAAVAALIAKQPPRLILNAAAYTAVDKAEAEPEAAYAVNSLGAETLARAAADVGVPLIHVSTDYVFDGSKTGAYVETDPVCPAGVYGASKADGEAKVRAAAPCHIILRTSWVYSCYGNNFLKTMLRLAGERDILKVVADQRGCPTSASDIAGAAMAIDTALGRRGEAVWGTYHFAGPGVASWHEFALAIIEAQAAFTGRKPPVEPISSKDYPAPARRPANSELDSGLFAKTFGYRAKDWRVRADETIRALLAPQPA